jgi:hypothetical protein
MGATGFGVFGFCFGVLVAKQNGRSIDRMPLGSGSIALLKQVNVTTKHPKSATSFEGI